MKITLATSNPHKVEEINLIAKKYDIKFVLPDGDFDPVEDSDNFIGNATCKVLEAVKFGNTELYLADDSGLCVDALDGAPGIYSARFLGHDTDYNYKNNYILDKLKDVPEDKRSARYACAVAAVWPDGREEVVTEYFEGRIGYEQKGNGGFGYDPIFFVPEYGKYAAELTPDQKNAMSHRGKALRAIKNILLEK